MVDSCSSSTWTRAEDKLFEQALVLFPDDTAHRWEKIAGQVPGKTWAEVKQHYEDLVHDVGEIDSGRVELPCYDDQLDDAGGWGGGAGQVCFGPSTKGKEAERKKGVPWTEEEHRLFLIGLQRYGKGDWRSISRNAVVSRTPTQVASHAQKYFLRLNSIKKDKKRTSIHDITTAAAAAADGSLSRPMSDPTWVNMMHQDHSIVEPFGPSNSIHLHDQASPLGYQGYGYHF